MSLQIVEKSGEGLSRVFGVTIPAQDLTERLEARIAEIAPTLNVKGFRPGRVPPAHVKRLYGRALMGEVVEQTLSETTQKVLEDNKVRPASEPDLKPEGDLAAVMEGRADLAYEIAVDVMPEFEPVDAATLSLKRPVYEPKEEQEGEERVGGCHQTNTQQPQQTA